MRIDALFGEPGRHVIDFDLIASQFRHLMRVAISVREGAISAPCCCDACAPAPARTPPTPPSTRLAASSARNRHPARGV
ncbi:hypothetical protein ACR6C2_27025 [Streptomyces sp. INA 01156]